MAGQLPVGPYRMIEVEPGARAAWYIIPFDAQGNCTAPLTCNHLVAAAQSADITDIILFVHGWNNDWNMAVGRYEDFLAGYSRMRQSKGLTYPRPFRPLLVGIFWPSTALVLPGERGPEIAAAPGDGAQRQDDEVAQDLQQIQHLVEVVPKKKRQRFYALTQQKTLDMSEARELAEMLLPLYSSARGPSRELPSDSAATTADQVLTLWRQSGSLRSEPSSGEGGFAREPGEGGFARQSADTPQAAGDLGFLDPRNIVRMATVLQMKDRAGVVGSYGVGPLLIDLLKAHSSTKLHLLGHSYGCRVVLSAICFRPLPRTVNSLLLLQPTVSHLCFAVDATGRRQPGGYRSALKRVEQPILTTFSRRDFPLTHLFHQVVRRAADLGELRIAGAPASPFAALGGYGPGGCAGECQELPIKPIHQHYDLDGSTAEVIALRAHEEIRGHGEISNEFTWWALYDQIAR